MVNYIKNLHYKNITTKNIQNKVEIDVTLWKEVYANISLDTSSEDGIVKTYLDLGNSYADKVRITFDDSCWRRI